MKLRPYPKYKPTAIEWLEEIPRGWEVSPLKRIIDVFLSNVDKHTVDGEQAVRLCNYVDVYKNERITADISFMAATASDEQIRRLSICLNDVLITKDSESPDDIGVPALVAENLSGVVCGYHLALLRPHKNTHGPYISWAMQSNYIQTYFSTRAVGMTRYALGKYAIENALLAVPPLLEQFAIAAFLDREAAKIDTLIAKQEKLIELLREKRQAVISHAVTKGLDRNVPMKATGVEWLGDVPKHWEVTGLTKYLESVVDYRGRTPTKVEEGVLLVTARNIRDGRVDYAASAEYILREEYDDVMRRGLPDLGDVLFTTEAPLGQVANVDRTDIALAQRIIKFRGDSSVVDNFFLKYWIMGSACQANLEQLATGSTALGIKGSKVGQVRLCIPPLDEQGIIVTYLDEATDKIDNLISKAQQAIELQKEHRTALISAAVTGKIDVRGLVAENVYEAKVA